MKPAADDLPARRSVWEALSELYLDTDVSLSLKWRVDLLAASPYAVDELEAILVDEVNPVCRMNMFVVTGAWAGFDLAWLESRILALRWPRPRRSWLHRVLPVRVVVPCWDDWLVTRDGVAAARAGSAG